MGRTANIRRVAYALFVWSGVVLVCDEASWLHAATAVLAFLLLQVIE